MILLAVFAVHSNQPDYETVHKNIVTPGLLTILQDTAVRPVLANCIKVLKEDGGPPSQRRHYRIFLLFLFLLLGTF